jgi:hypothetical protein
VKISHFAQCHTNNDSFNRKRTYRHSNEVHFEIPPIARSTVSRIVAKLNETGSVRDIPRFERPAISDNTKLNLLLSLEDNSHASTTEVALQENVSQSFVVKLLKKEKLHS